LNPAANDGSALCATAAGEDENAAADQCATAGGHRRSNRRAR
jgi:hypothetical protein